MDPEELARQADEDFNTVIVEPEPVDSDDDDVDDDEGPAPAPEARPSRSERRGQRAGNFKELKESNERLQRELQETRMAQSRMEGLLQANMRPPQQQGPHPAVLEVEEAMREQDEFYKAFTAQLPSMSEAQKEQAAGRARALEIKKGLAMSKLAMAQQGISQAPQPQQIRQMAFQEQLNMRYSDIAADPKATELGGHIARAMFAEGKPQTWETLDEAAEETRRRLGMPSTRNKPRPTEAQKQKFVSAPRGASGPSVNENKPLRITKKQAQMAENAYPSLPAGKAHQKWWNEVGKKYA